MEQRDASKIRLVVLADDDERALAEFYRKCWGSSGSKDAAEGAGGHGVAPVESCPFRESMPAPVVGIYDGEDIVAHLGSIPAEFWDGSRAVAAHWIKGFMVMEAYRNGPLGFMLAKHMANQVGVSGVMVVAPAARRLFGALGYRDMGAVANFVALLNPVRVLRSLDLDRLGMASLPKFMRAAIRVAQWPAIAWLGGMVIRGLLVLVEGLCRLAYLDLQTKVSPVPPPAEEIDRLWLQMRARLEFAASRSSAYIGWRYVGKNSGRYEFVAVRQGGRLAGLVVVRRPERMDDPRLAGLRVGLVVDLIVDPANSRAVCAGLSAARSWARARDCDAILLTIAQRDIGRVAVWLGYVKIPGNVHFLLRVPPGTIAAPNGLAGAWLTRGDAWGDDI